MNARIGIVPALAAAALLAGVLLPSRTTQAAQPEPGPFDACSAVGAHAAAEYIGGPIRNNAPNYREVEATPRQSALCVYDGVRNGGQLSILLLRFGTTAKDRESLAAFRSSYEKTATAQYGEPTTTTDGDATVVAFRGINGNVLDVTAFTNTAAARITLTFGKAQASDLDALALSLVHRTYGPAPSATPAASPDFAPCGRRAAHAPHRG